MRKIKDVLRLKLDAKLSHQQIADALGISKGVVTKYVGLAAVAGLDWPAVQAASDTELMMVTGIPISSGQGVATTNTARNRSTSPLNAQASRAMDTAKGVYQAPN